MNSLPTKEMLHDYAVQGPSNAVPIVFLHGLGDSLRSFDPILSRLPGTIYAVAASQRGHGENDRPSEGYTPGDFAADVATLMDQLGLQKAVVVGHSLGATVAQRFALTYPDRTYGLVLTGSFFKGKGHPGLVELWDSMVSTLEDPIDPAIIRSFQMSTISKPLPAAFLDTVVRESLKVPARVWKATLRGLIETDFTRELSNIRVPTLLLWGERDTFVSRSEQDRLLAAIPGSRLKIFAGVGHAPHWEVPDQFAAQIADFMLL